MTVKEEKILLMAKESKEPKDILAAVKQVVQNCIVQRGHSDHNVTKEGKDDYRDVNSLALVDIDYLFIKLRAASVSNKTKVSYIDNDDNQTYDFDIDLEDVKVKYPEKVLDNIKVSDSIGIVLKYPPASLYSDEEFAKAEGDDLIYILIDRSLVNVYDGAKVTEAKDIKMDELKEWIDSMAVKPYNDIKEFFANLPSLHYEIKYTNKNGKERNIVLSTLNDFFTLS